MHDLELKKELKGKMNFQSNDLTLATYGFTAAQKNIIYWIIQVIEDPLKSKKEIKANLFGERIVTFPKKYILKYRNNVALLKRDLQVLREQSIFFKANGGEVCTGFILQFYVHPRQDVEIHLSNYFIEKVRHGMRAFTAYQLSVALTLKGVHAKRFYEICCMAKKLNEGKYRTSLNELKKTLCVDKKYQKLHDFEKRVLKPAQKRINECEAAEVSFDYKFEKKNREVFVILKVKDKKKEAEKLKNLKAGGELTPKQKMNQAAIYLGERFGKKHKYYEIFNVLKAKGQIADFVVKYREKLNYYEKKGKSDEEFQKIITKILKEDFRN